MQQYESESRNGNIHKGEASSTINGDTTHLTYSIDGVACMFMLYIIMCMRSHLFPL